MIHMVYIYNKAKELIRKGTIHCNEYCITARDTYMVLNVLSGTVRYNIYGKYIIVI